MFFAFVAYCHQLHGHCPDPKAGGRQVAANQNQCRRRYFSVTEFCGDTWLTGRGWPNKKTARRN